MTEKYYFVTSFFFFSYFVSAGKNIKSIKLEINKEYTFFFLLSVRNTIKIYYILKEYTNLY